MIGNPGSTGRLNTMAQLEYLRDVTYPRSSTPSTGRLRYTTSSPRMDDTRAQALRNTIFGLQNIAEGDRRLPVRAARPGADGAEADVGERTSTPR